MPEEQEEEKQSRSPKDRTLVDDVLRAQAEAVKIRAVRDVMRDDQEKPQAEQPIKISANLDLAQLIKSSQDAAHDAQSQLSEERAQRMVALESQLQDIKEKLQAPGKSEVETYREVKGLLDGMAEELKGKLGVGAGAPVSAADMPGLLSLEEKRLEREERARQWQEQMEERRHQWQVEREEMRRRWEEEDRRWVADHELRKEELGVSRDTRGKATDALSDLAASVIEAIDTEKGQPVREKVVPTMMVKSFACQECGQKVEVPREAKESATVACPGCKAEYTLERRSDAAEDQR